MQALPEYTLAIEVSNPGADAAPAAGAAHPPRSGVAVGRRDQDAGPIECVTLRWLSPRSRHDDALMPAIDEACQSAGIAPRQISRVAVSIGPGGYTSLRIGVTIAKMIALATGAACIPVPTPLAVLANLGPQLPAARRCLVCLAWKRDSVWCQDFAADGASWTPLDAGRLLQLDQLSSDAPDLVVAEPALVAMLPCALPGRVLEPVFDPRGVLTASASLPPVDPLALAPLYPREPEAVSKWRELHPR